MTGRTEHERAAAALARLNDLPAAEARAALTNCCGSSKWVAQMLASMPFAEVESVHATARAAFSALAGPDWLEAFAHHPRIGDVESLKKKFAATAAWAGDEQSGTASASDEVIRALAEGNDAYFAKFGFIFIVCATGKSAAEMAALLNTRLPNNAGDESRIAGGEQAKITALRLDKLLRELA